MSRIAYLDISPRQTGKTSRLIDRARALLTNDQRVCFVTVEGMKNEVQRALPRALVLADGDTFPQGENPDASVWFYDEFDWLESVKVRPGAYYATTPRFLRRLGEASPENDILLRIVESAGGRFERFYWPFEMGNVVREARQAHPPDEFRRLYLGEYLT
ncbi:hypothetical protein AB2C92_07130 [Pseudomonas aeruginosa]